MNDVQKAYEFASTYGDEFTAFHCHMISVVVFFYSNTLQIMLVDYAVTDMGCFDDYSYTERHAKTMRGYGITKFFFNTV